MRSGRVRHALVQAVKWDVLQQLCQTLMNKPLGMISMMISKRVNANAPTLERSPISISIFLKQKSLGRSYMPELKQSEV